MAAQITMKGSLIGEHDLPGGGVESIVWVEEEQRPQGGPARPSIVAVHEQDGRRVAGYVPWINYYDVDEAARQAPGEWTVVEPAKPYEEVVEWRPWGVRTAGRAGSQELAELLADLAQTPAKLRRMAGTLGAASATPPATGEWSLDDLVLHVTASDSILAPRVMQIATQPGIVLPDVDVTNVQRILARAKTGTAERLAGFEARRREWIAAVDQLTAEELAHTGEHTVHGTTSVLDVCRALLDHEREHLDQGNGIVDALQFPLA